MNTVRLNVNITDELNNRLETLAAAGGMTKSDLLRRAIALMEVASEESAKGNRLAITDKKHKVLREIVGL